MAKNKTTAIRVSCEEVYAQAFYYALRAHESQFRKGTGRPYIEHPLRVAALLMELGCRPELVVAGFLHDVIEDTGKGQEEIRLLFGKRAAGLVQAVSEDKELSWEDRKRRTITFIKKAAPEPVLLEFADKLDNLRSIRSDYERTGDEVWTRFQKPRDSQEWYYRSLLKAFSGRMREKRLRPYICEMQELVEKLFG